MRIIAYAGLFFNLATNAFFVVLFILYPNGSAFLGAGEHASLTTTFQSSLNVVLIVVVAAIALSVGVIFFGTILEGAGRRSERIELLKAAESPDSMRVAPALREDYSDRRTVLLAIVIAVVGSVLLIAGITTLMLAAANNSVFRHASALYSRYGQLALMTIGVAVLLLLVSAVWNAVVSVRGARLRNLLMARWPQLPKEATESVQDAEMPLTYPARVGPALTPEAERGNPV